MSFCYVRLIVFKGFDDFLRASNNISRQGKIVKDKGLTTRYIKMLILTKVEAN